MQLCERLVCQFYTQAKTWDQLISWQTTTSSSWKLSFKLTDIKSVSHGTTQSLSRMFLSFSIQYHTKFFRKGPVWSIGRVVTLPVCLLFDAEQVLCSGFYFHHFYWKQLPAENFADGQPEQWAETLCKAPWDWAELQTSVCILCRLITWVTPFKVSHCCHCRLIHYYCRVINNDTQLQYFFEFHVLISRLAWRLFRPNRDESFRTKMMSFYV